MVEVRRGARRIVRHREVDAFIRGFGTTAVVAPHPDDESIGCGGLIALLRERDLPVTVILVSDGTMSHPHSARFPPARRRDLRRREMQCALDVLGVRSALIELGLPDGSVPGPSSPRFRAAAAGLGVALREVSAATVLAPWRRDPHPDHRATSEMVRAAIAAAPTCPRLIEYAVWIAERGSGAERPAAGEASVVYVDIQNVRAKKARAVAAHASQQGKVIDDDPRGFALSPSMLAHALRRVEVFYECPVRESASAS